MNSLKETSYGNFENDDYLFFWHGCLSNWSFGLYDIDYANTPLVNINPLSKEFKEKFPQKITFNCGEQGMMYEKARMFNDYETAANILKTKTPSLQKSLGRKVKNYEENVWSKHRLEIVTEVLYHRFNNSNNIDLLNFLLNTKTKTLVEASSYDTIWGIGMDVNHPDILNENKWKGQNLLGKALMNVREDMQIIIFGNKLK